MNKNINETVLNELAFSRQDLIKEFESQIEQLSKHWMICLYFHMVLGETPVIPTKHWIDEIAKFTDNIAKVQLKDKNNPNNRRSVLFQAINKGNTGKVSHNKLYGYLQKKFTEEVNNSISPVIKSLRFNPEYGERCASYFSKYLIEHIVYWIANCLDKDGNKTNFKNWYEAQFDGIFAEVDANKANQVNESEIDRIKSLFFKETILF